PWPSRLLLLAAVMVTFSSVGFVGDLLALATFRPMTAVVITAIASGLTSAAIVLTVMFGPRFVPIAVVIQFFFLMWLGRSLPGSASHAPTVAAMAHRATI